MTEWKSTVTYAPKEVMTLKETAEYLSITPDTLYLYLKQKKVPAFKLGNQWRFKKSVLDNWMENQSEKSEKNANKTR